MTAIPEAYDAYLELVQRVLPGVQVLDGPGVEDLKPDVIAVGWATDRASVTGDTEREGFSPDDRERFEIVTTIDCTHGETTVKPLRIRAFGYYRTVAAELRRDPRMNKTVLFARPFVVDLDQVQTDRGAAVALVFTVECEAFA